MADAPAWFVRALANPPERRAVAVDGCTITYSRWGDPARPGLLLVHGGGANSHWWDHIAPLLVGEHCVVAPDLSGHGRSDRRLSYDMPGWAGEIAAVAEHAELAPQPIVVGHSMGGFVAIWTAARQAADVAAIIVVDSPVGAAVTPEQQASRARLAFGPLRSYPPDADPAGRFRPVPGQEVVLPYVRRHVAESSVDRTPTGWRWQFDPAVFTNLNRPAEEMLLDVRCRVAILRAEHGLLTADIGDRMYERLGRVAPVIELPDTGHHPMLDQPLVLVTALRALLADWEHSAPQRRA